MSFLAYRLVCGVLVEIPIPNLKSGLDHDSELFCRNLFFCLKLNIILLQKDKDGGENGESFHHIVLTISSVKKQNKTRPPHESTLWAPNYIYSSTSFHFNYRNNPQVKTYYFSKYRNRSQGEINAYRAPFLSSDTFNNLEDLRHQDLPKQVERVRSDKFITLTFPSEHDSWIYLYITSLIDSWEQDLMY